MLVFNIEELERIAENHLQTKNYLNCAQTLSLIADFFINKNDEEKYNFYYQKILNCFKISAEQEDIDFMEAAERWCGAACLAKDIDLNEYKKCVNKMVESLESAALNALKKENYNDAGEYYQQAGKYIKDELDDKKFQNFFKKAIECYSKIINVRISPDQKEELAKFYIKIARLYEELDDQANALNLYNEAIQAIESNKIVSSYELLAKIYNYKAKCLQKYPVEKVDPEDLILKSINYLSLEADKNLELKNYLKAAENLCLANNLYEKIQKKELNIKNLIIKEANCYKYVADMLKSNGDILQAAKFERDAAFCYYKLNDHNKAIKLLLITAEQMENEKQYLISAENYRDASLVYDQLKDYINCGECAFKGGNLAKIGGDEYSALENFKIAFNCFSKIGEKDLIHKCKKELTNCLSKIAEGEIEVKNYHLGGTYLFEAAKYEDNEDLYRSYLRRSLDSYLKAIDIAIDDSNFFIAAYSLCCAGLVMVLLNRTNDIINILKEYPELNNERYTLFLNDFVNSILTKDISNQKLKNIKEKYYKLISNSNEIQNLVSLIEQRVGEN